MSADEAARRDDPPHIVQAHPAQTIGAVAGGAASLYGGAEEKRIRSASSGCDMQPPRLVDMHCHLDRMRCATRVAQEASMRGIGIFCTTVTPEDALRAQELFAGFSRIRVGVGMHPWWVTDEPEQGLRTRLAAETAASSRYVGEIGLDFSPAHIGTSDAQLSAFEDIVAACASERYEGRVLSIHAVRSAGYVLDILERHRMAGEAACVFHWFSGTSDEFARARDMECYFSVSERMLATKRGREYARQIPQNKLLIETDAPEQLDDPYDATRLHKCLQRTISKLARARSEQSLKLARAILRVSNGLLDF